MSATQTIAPEDEPVTLLEAKHQIRLDEADDAPNLVNYIAAARRYVEEQTRRQLVTSTWKLKLDDFPISTAAVDRNYPFFDSDRSIRLPRPPLQSVTEITYIDTAGDLQPLLSTVYDVDTFSEPGRIALAFSQQWPAIRKQIDAVTIEFVCGYGAVAAVPATFKQMVLLLVDHSWGQRSPIAIGTIVAELPFSLRSLIMSERIVMEAA